MIRKTTTFAKLLAACPYIQLLTFRTLYKKDTPIAAATWLEARLMEKGIQLSEITQTTVER